MTQSKFGFVLRTRSSSWISPASDAVGEQSGDHANVLTMEAVITPSLSRLPESGHQTAGEPMCQLWNVKEGRSFSLFEMALEATEEAVYNSLLKLLKATTVHSQFGTAEATPINAQQILANYELQKSRNV